jgi:hypothetical protein
MDCFCEAILILKCILIGDLHSGGLSTDMNEQDKVQIEWSKMRFVSRGLYLKIGAMLLLYVSLILFLFVLVFFPEIAFSDYYFWYALGTVLALTMVDFTGRRLCWKWPKDPSARLAVIGSTVCQMALALPLEFRTVLVRPCTQMPTYFALLRIFLIRLTLHTEPETRFPTGELWAGPTILFQAVSLPGRSLESTIRRTRAESRRSSMRRDRRNMIPSKKPASYAFQRHSVTEWRNPTWPPP